MSADIRELFNTKQPELAVDLLTDPSLPKHSYKARKAILRDALLDSILGNPNDPKEQALRLLALHEFVHKLRDTEPKVYLSLLTKLLPDDTENIQQLTTNNTLVIVDQADRPQNTQSLPLPQPEVPAKRQELPKHNPPLPLALEAEFVEKQIQQEISGAILAKETKLPQSKRSPSLRLKLPVKKHSYV